jgi:EAL domain-containing protein (putative c-di-GMP-specific phosphodiesterase class I)
MARVLLVDDDPDFLRIQARILEDEFQLDLATDGEEALRAATLRSFDAIVTDIQMPQLDGVQFLRRLRESDLDVPVILLTGNPVVETAARAVEYGAFRYLTKPVSVPDLRQAVRQAVRLHEFARVKRQALEITGVDGKSLGDRASLEARFDRALEGIWMAYQPIVRSGSGEVFAYEALLRTSEAAIGGPADLLDAAERLGRVHELGRKIRRKVVAQIDECPSQSLIFINLHPHDLLDDELYSSRSPLSRQATRVVLEVTERASLDGVSNVLERAAALRKLGFRIALDDLGAGYAGLNAFTQLEPDLVKLDMALVRQVESRPTSRSVIRSMVRLCDELGLRLVAEGIETAAEYQTLCDLGCHLLQGYLLAKPDPRFRAAAGPVMMPGPVRPRDLSAH